MEIYANKIPAEEITNVATVVQRVEQNKFKANRNDIEYLFKVYHKYLAPYDKQNIDCKACRAKVCGIFFQIAKVWKEKSKN